MVGKWAQLTDDPDAVDRTVGEDRQRDRVHEQLLVARRVGALVGAECAAPHFLKARRRSSEGEPRPPIASVPGSARRRAPEPAAAPYDAERAVPPRLPAQPLVARLLRAAVVLLGTVALTRGALRLLRALAPLLPRLGFALK